MTSPDTTEVFDFATNEENYFKEKSAQFTGAVITPKVVGLDLKQPPQEFPYGVYDGNID